MRVLALASLLAAFSATASAAPLFGFNQFTATGNLPRSADFLDPAVQSAILDVQGVSPVTGPSFNCGAGEFCLGDSPNTAPGTWNTAPTIDPAEFIEIAVTTAPGQQLSLQSLQLNASRDEIDLDLVVRSSADGFSSDLAIFDLSFTPTLFEADLSSLPLLDGTLTFRLFGINANSATVFFVAEDTPAVVNGGFLGLTGDVVPAPVPLPASATLLLTGIFGLALYRVAMSGRRG